jgi:hypothetical protein
MRSIKIIVTVFLLLSLVGCYGPITGIVVDAETGKPIKEAVVLVEWTSTKGIGLTHTGSYKVVEIATNKEGMFTVSGVLNPFVNPPNVTVYKKGYVAWNNKFIFPDYRKRNEFRWQDAYVFKLVKFKDAYSYIDHEIFIDGAVHVGLSSEKKQLFLKAYHDGEREKVMIERRKRDTRQTKESNGVSSRHSTK